MYVLADWQRTVNKEWGLCRAWMCAPQSSASPTLSRQWGAKVAGCCVTCSWTKPSCQESATSLKMKPCLTQASTQPWRLDNIMNGIQLRNKKRELSQTSLRSCIIEQCVAARQVEWKRQSSTLRHRYGFPSVTSGNGNVLNLFFKTFLSFWRLKVGFRQIHNMICYVTQYTLWLSWISHSGNLKELCFVFLPGNIFIQQI